MVKEYIFVLGIIIIILLFFILIVPIVDLILLEETYNIEKESGMRFATYNMMYGMYGKTLFFNALGHLSIHVLRSKILTNFLSRFNKKTVELMANTDADVLVINEVLGSLKEKEIIQEFKKRGYNFSCFGSARSPYEPLDMGTLIVSKNKFERLNLSVVAKDKKGGVGGACAIYFKEKNLTVIGIHFGLLDKYSSKQIVEIALFIEEQKNLKRKVVLVGDFNMNSEELNSFSDFEELGLKNANMKGTTPDIFEIKLFKFEAYDNIFFTDDLKLKKSDTVKGYSDHRLVWADLE